MGCKAIEHRSDSQRTWFTIGPTVIGTKANLRTQFLKILKRAVGTPWERMFHSIRVNRQTELEAIFPTYVVCSWMGNSEAIAKKNYFLVTESDYGNALNGPKTSEKSALWRELLMQQPSLYPMKIEGNCRSCPTLQTPCKIQCDNSAILSEVQEKTLFSRGKQGFSMEATGRQLNFFLRSFDFGMRDW